MDLDLEKMFNEEFAKSSGGYDEQIKGYEEAQVAEQAALEDQRNRRNQQLQADRLQSQQNAYVSKRMAEKNMPQMLAAQGITGGMAETSASNVFNDYLKAKTAANSTYSKANSDLEGNYMKNSTELKSKYTQLLNELRQKQQADSWEKMQWAYQAKVAEDERKKQEQEKLLAQASKGGSSGSAGGHRVADIQRILNNAGFSLAVDGKWGPKTASAVRAYQMQNGLVADGIVGSKTWASLNG